MHKMIGEMGCLVLQNDNFKLGIQNLQLIQL